MARKTATYVTCDGPNCNDVAEIHDESKDAPEGWYHVMPAVQNGTPQNPSQDPAFTYRRDVHFEFSKLQCLEKWARERRKHLEGKTTRSTPNATNDQILNSIEIGFQLLSDKGEEWVKIDDLAEITGIHRTTTRRYVYEMARRGEVEIKESRSSKNTLMTLYRFTKIRPKEQ